MLSSETHFTSRDTYKLKVRGWKKIFHANRDQMKAGVAILISDRKDLKEYYKRQRRTLHNDQRINPRRRYNNFKYLRTQHRFTTIYKASANNLKRRNQQNTIIVLTSHLQKWTDQPDRKSIRKHRP